MADSELDPKAGGSFFRKVVKFVANPSTDWSEIASNNQEEALQGGYAKSELKAMIERKRRNDFVRKREFDLLRKIRREGLPADGLGLGASSELEDSEPRSQGVARADDAAVKAKIDEIEQQMEGESNARRAPPQRPPAFYAQPTERGGFDETAPPLNEPFQVEPPAAPAPQRRAIDAASVVASLGPVPARKPPPDAVPVVNEVDWEATAAYTHRADNTALGGIAGVPLGTGKAPAPKAANGAIGPAGVAPAATAPVAAPASAPRPAPAAVQRPIRHGSSDFNNPFDVEVNEIAHDPELDEAVISFANAEYEACEKAITSLIAPHGDRANHAETWLVLFDLYRATGQQQPFESLVLDYVQRFGWSAPQWFSIPALAAAEAAQQPSPVRSVHIEGSVGWAAPATMDAAAVAQLDTQTSKMPLPWLIDWRGLETFDLEGCSALARLMRHWATQKLEMRWVGQEHLLELLRRAAPNGTRDADPAYWLLRLEVLRLTNRPDHFDEVAIDYCVTYEVSPPSWEPCKCTVKQADGTGITLAARSVLPEATSSFPESVQDDAGMRTATVDLSGQLVGDIGTVLKQLEDKLGEAGVVSINCARLVRMDFIAAGDLLNWVLQRRNEQRLVHFDDAHRLLGLFFNAMGINEHARVKVRNI